MSKSFSRSPASIDTSSSIGSDLVPVAIGATFSILLVAGSFLIYRLTLSTLPTPFVAALATVQVSVIAGVLTRKWALRYRVGLWAGLLAAGAAPTAVPGLPERLVVLAMTGGCHAIAYSALIIWFGMSLRAGREPIVTGFARRLRQTMPDSVVRYTRNVTIAWCGFFACQLIMSATLLLLAPQAAWSAFVTLLNLPLVIMMTLAEFACRQVLFRHENPTSLARTLSALRHGTLMPADRS
jgi:uncharacterized membrane protein